jgi:hypothetical protein
MQHVDYDNAFLFHRSAGVNFDCGRIFQDAVQNLLILIGETFYFSATKSLISA